MCECAQSPKNTLVPLNCTNIILPCFNYCLSWPHCHQCQAHKSMLKWHKLRGKTKYIYIYISYISTSSDYFTTLTIYWEGMNSLKERKREKKKLEKKKREWFHRVTLICVLWLTKLENDRTWAQRWGMILFFSFWKGRCSGVSFALSAAVIYNSVFCGQTLALLMD